MCLVWKGNRYKGEYTFTTTISSPSESTPDIQSGGAVYYFDSALELTDFNSAVEDAEDIQFILINQQD